MNKQIAGFFDRFYHIALRSIIQDPLIHAEWTYFQAMVSNSLFEKDRINMYLDVLQSEKNKGSKEQQLKTDSGKTSTYQQKSANYYQPAQGTDYQKQSSENYTTTCFKLEKRFSEPMKHDYLSGDRKSLCAHDCQSRRKSREKSRSKNVQFEQYSGKEPLRQRRDALKEIVNGKELNLALSPKKVTPKARDQSLAQKLKCLQKSGLATPLRPGEQRADYLRMCQAANNLLEVFQAQTVL